MASLSYSLQAKMLIFKGNLMNIHNTKVMEVLPASNYQIIFQSWIRLKIIADFTLCLIAMQKFIKE